MTQSNLGNAYSDRIRGEQSDNLELAIQHYNNALLVHTKNAMPVDWAVIQYNLGIAYIKRIRGERADNLELAIQHYNNALLIHTKDAMPVDWADTQSGLGAAYSYRIRGKRADNLELAIQHCNNALLVRTKDAMSVQWAETQVNLGAAYSARIRGERVENLELAIQHYNNALLVHTKNAMPVQWAATQHNLGAAYSEGIRGERVENLELAIQHYNNALLVRTKHAMPVDCRRTSKLLGNLLFEQLERWEEAANAYEQAIDATELLYSQSLMQESKQSELAEAAAIYHNAAFCLAKMGRTDEAAVYLERSRARTLKELLERDRTDLETVKTHSPSLYERYLKSVENLKGLEIQEREFMLRESKRGEDTCVDENQLRNIRLELVNEHKKARAKFDEIIAEIRQLPDYSQFLTLPDWQTLSNQMIREDTRTMVYLATTNKGTLILALMGGHSSCQPEIVWCNDFQSKDLDKILITGDSEQSVGGYLIGQFQHSHIFEDTLPQWLEKLGANLLKPLAKRLTELETSWVVLIPCGRLSLLPLHTAYWQTEGNEHQYFFEQFEVVYAPSASSLVALEQKALERQNIPEQLAGVGDPLPSPECVRSVQSSLKKSLPALRSRIKSLARQLKLPDVSEIEQEQCRTTGKEKLYEWWRKLHETERELADLCELDAKQAQYKGIVLKQALDMFGSVDIFEELRQKLLTLAVQLQPSLSYAKVELEGIEDLLKRLPKQPTYKFHYETDATAQNLWQSLERATIAHLSCHGSFDSDSPLDSGLVLAAESKMSLRDLLNEHITALKTLRFVFLSACQTALSDFRQIPDEFIGLPYGFLQAGVPSVIGTLWPVSDYSTAFLVTRFYELFLLGEPENNIAPQLPHNALFMAQRWLRDLSYEELSAYLEHHKQLKEQTTSPVISENYASTRLPISFLQNAIESVNKARMVNREEERPFAHPYYWAGFACYGII
jgi:CHAT domain-containing protein/tetratricopeptide (TPR) repeat protein